MVKHGIIKIKPNVSLKLKFLVQVASCWYDWFSTYGGVFDIYCFKYLLNTGVLGDVFTFFLCSIFDMLWMLQNLTLNKL